MTEPRSKLGPIKLGVIGCGAFAQLMHLRVLAELPQFELAAICDTSPQVLDAIGDRYSVTGRYGSVEDVLRHPGLEAVLIADRLHYEACTLALEMGKHVLVEKPLCLDPGEGHEMADLADKSDLVAMVGYMKRYDWGYRELKQRIDGLGELALVRVHDFKCQIFRWYSLYDLVRRSDVSATEKEAEATAMRTRMRNAIGDAGSVDLYRSLLLFASHDLNLLRGLLGAPREINAVHVSDDNKTIVAVLDHGRGGPAILELSTATDYGWFEEEVTVAAKAEMLTLRFPHPYVHYGQSELTARSHNGAVMQNNQLVGPYTDGFRGTWEHFAECIHDGRKPDTSFRDSLADVELAVELTRRGAANS